MFQHFSSTFYNNMINTLVSLLAVLIVFVLVKIAFIRKIDNQKKKKQVTIRAFYVAVLILLFFMARIWVDGFMHLLTVLGLVSAGLVVTNKETIMNLVGWMIITWRGVFSEDDLIQVQNYKGYVKSIGVLYITLQEVSDNDFSRLTGKEIKVPNGLTANNAVINYSQTARLILVEYKMKLPYKNLNQYKEEALTKVQNLVSDFYKYNKSYSKLAVWRFDHSLKNKIDFSPKIVVFDDVEVGKPVTCSVNFYCFVEDKAVLLNRLSSQLLSMINA